MIHLASNVLYFKDKYEPNMTANNSSTLNAVRSTVQAFNKQRSSQSQLRQIEVFPYSNEKGIENELMYVVRIRGRKNSYYQNRVITFFMFFMDSFPREPPEIVASHLLDKDTKKERRFLHLNCSERGQFCIKTNQKDQQYFECITVRDILLQLELSIYSPNVTSSYNNELYQAYTSQGHNAHYYQLLNAQSKLLQQVDDSSSDSEGDLQ